MRWSSTFCASEDVARAVTKELSRERNEKKKGIGR